MTAMISGCLVKLPEHIQVYIVAQLNRQNTPKSVVYIVAQLILTVAILLSTYVSAAVVVRLWVFVKLVQPLPSLWLTLQRYLTKQLGKTCYEA